MTLPSFGATPAQIVIAQKDALESLDPDIAGDPATIHTTLSKLPQFTLEPPENRSSRLVTPVPSRHATPANSVPSSPKQADSPRLSSLHDSLDGSSIFGDSLVHIGGGGSIIEDPAFRRTPRSHGPTPPHNRAQYSHTPPRRTRARALVPIETVFNTALHLWQLYPLEHPSISADTIFGPLAAVHTWDNRELSTEQAECIIRDGKDVVIAEPVKEQEREQEDLDKIADGGKDAIGGVPGRKRELELRNFARGIGKLVLAHRPATVFTVVGLAGVLLAMYAGAGSALVLSAREELARNAWMRKNWLVRAVVARI